MRKYFKGAKISNFILLTIAGFVNAFGVTAFLAPMKLYDSGILAVEGCCKNNIDREKGEGI